MRIASCLAKCNIFATSIHKLPVLWFAICRSRHHSRPGVAQPYCTMAPGKVQYRLHRLLALLTLQQLLCSSQYELCLPEDLLSYYAGRGDSWEREAV